LEKLPSSKVLRRSREEDQLISKQGRDVGKIAYYRWAERGIKGKHTLPCSWHNRKRGIQKGRPNVRNRERKTGGIPHAARQ